MAKKHGIKIGKNPNQEDKKTKDKSKISFGFYNYLIVILIFITVILRLLYFTKENIIEIFPLSQIYIDHLFETIKNIKEIILNFY